MLEKVVSGANFLGRVIGLEKVLSVLKEGRSPTCQSHFGDGTALGFKDLVVRGLACDSRKVKPEYLFFAIKGEKADGHEFVDDALSRGAVAVVAERPLGLRNEVPVLLVNDTREALARVACLFYDYPSRKLDCIGVTGTNGKTTTTFLIRSILETAGIPTGLLGTVHYQIGRREIPATHTTPESLDIQAHLSDMVEEGLSAAVLEVSSHALEQRRTEGISFRAAVFTNLTAEHLDFHKDMESYRRAKEKLFSRLAPEALAVLNVDDPAGESYASSTHARVVTYGLERPADFTARVKRVGLEGTSLEIISKGKSIAIETPLIGRHNVYNILGAFSATSSAFHLDWETIVAGIMSVRGVPGRLEAVEAGQDFRVLVDYAHTDDALRQVLGSLRELVKRRLILVFGCGGDRDRGKRPRMGAVAEEFADEVWLTNDNPRTEEPVEIIRQIQAGISRQDKFHVEPDRSLAIRQAIESARRDDLVLVAGKGHETYQILRDTVVPFDDRTAAREALERFKSPYQDAT